MPDDGLALCNLFGFDRVAHKIGVTDQISIHANTLERRRQRVDDPGFHPDRKGHSLACSCKELNKPRPPALLMNGKSLPYLLVFWIELVNETRDLDFLDISANVDKN